LGTEGLPLIDFREMFKFKGERMPDMRTIKQDTVNRFCLFRNQNYSRILKDAQKVKAKAGKKNETR
jgi:hypothetical protein